VRDVIPTFNAKGLAALDPRWAGGRPRLISDGDIGVIVTAARTRPDGYRLFVIMTTWRRTRPRRSGAGPGGRTPGCASRPANASWATPIEAQFGPVRSFVMGGSDHRNHPALARKLQDCLRWRNAHPRHPGVLAAQRRERARIRSERQQRRGRPEPEAA